jgi:hypothetical protein
MALKDPTEKRFKREMKFNLRGLTLKGERRKPKWGPRFLVQYHTGQKDGGNLIFIHFGF